MTSPRKEDDQEKKKSKEGDQEKKKNKVEKFLEQAGEIIDPIGRAIFGSLWRDVYETLQDAIYKL